MTRAMNRLFFALTRSRGARVGLVALLLVHGLAAGCASDDGAARGSEEAAAPKGPPLFLWKVTRSGAPGTVYLLGSVHLQRRENAGLDLAVSEALKSADELVFEVAPAEMDTGAIQQLTRDRGLVRPGESLSDHLSPETYERLQAANARLGLPGPLFDRMRPWLAALTLTVTKMKLEGYSDEAGVEQLVLAAAEDGSEREVRTSSLETVEMQIGLFADLDADTQEAMLIDTLDALESREAMLADIETAYAAGDTQQVEALVLGPGRDNPKLAGFYKKMFDDRNVGMATRIAPFVDKKQVTFVTVGVGHTVGEQGVVALLKNKGLSVERVAPRGRPEPPPAPDGEAAPPSGPPPIALEPQRHEELGFEVAWPGQPSAQTQNAPARPDGTPASRWTVFSDVSATVAEFDVIVVDWPASVGEAPDAEKSKLLQRYAVLLTQTVGPLESTEAVVFAGQPAMRLKTAGGPPTLEGYLFFSGARMYYVFAVALGNVSDAVQEVRRDAVARFFSSFRLFEATTAPDPGNGGGPAMLGHAAHLQAQELRKALDLFKLIHGRYPTDEEGLAALTRPVEGKRPLMEAVPVDPWGRPFRLIAEPSEGGGPLVVSSGPDGVAGTDDDVASSQPPPPPG